MYIPRLSEIIDNYELRELRDLYRRDWPKNCVGYYCLDNFYKWRISNGSKVIKNLKIFKEAEYETSEKNSNDGLYIIIDRYQLFIGSLNKTDFVKLIKTLNLLDWSKGFKVSSFLECHRPSILNIINKKGLKCEYDSKSLLYYMSQEEANKLQISCPKEFYVKNISSAIDAEIIDKFWPNHHQGSLFLIRRLIDKNQNAGVYTEATNELVAWCLRLQGGFLGVLQVKDNYKRLKLGTVVTCAISRHIAKQGDDVMALVNPENIPSCGMFNKLGFTVIDHCYWMRTLPAIDNYEWNEEE